VAQIARAWWLARQSVQRVADLLVDDGLAVYEDNPSHRRAKLVRITAAGLTTLRTIRLAQKAWADQLGEDIGEGDLRAINERLPAVIAALERRSARGSTAPPGPA
jgi:DNA-binding MarR family transcriptional regulator